MPTPLPKLLYECPSFILMEKPHGLATVPLKKQASENGPTRTLLGYASNIDMRVLEVQGRNPWEGGAIHRLDTDTSGIVMFAKDQDFYDYMREAQQNDLFEKYYIAKTTENDSLKGIDMQENNGIIGITSYFRPYGPGSKQVRPTTDIKRATPKAEYTTLARRNADMFLCSITKGFRHQIRAHLAWTGHPIVGDPLYGESFGGSFGESYRKGQWGNYEKSHEGTKNEAPHLQLTCVGISFKDPKGQVQTFMEEGNSIQDFPHSPFFAFHFKPFHFNAQRPAMQFAKTDGDAIIWL